MVVPTGPDYAAPYTLHVYSNLVQVPTLVLNQHGTVETGLQLSDFRMQLDAGPSFAPLSYRVEGKDPLNMALVVDVSAAVAPKQLARFQQNFRVAVSSLFTQEDKLSLYAINCVLGRSRVLQMAATDSGIPHLLDEVIEKAKTGKADTADTGCAGQRRLWDAVALAVKHLESAPGRRVVLVLSDGADQVSMNNWNEVREFAAGLGVAVFGIRSQPMLLSPNRAGGLQSAREDVFDLLCGGTGGVAFMPKHGDLEAGVAEAMQMIRGRYVLEFQRPRNSTAGHHLIEVKVPDRKAMVRPGGVAVKLMNASIANDPSTVPMDDSKAPSVGNRRPLDAWPR